MGVVYEALDTERKARVALKTVRIQEPNALLRLKNEFRALRDLQHRNLVSFGELFEAAGHWFFTMELVEGVDWLQFVRSASAQEPETVARGEISAEGPTVTLPAHPPSTPPADRSPAAPLLFDEARLREALLQLALGLQALHDANKVHRDIKPSNLLVTSEPRVVVLDFGLVSDLVEKGTSIDEVAGTYTFMAPEQTRPGPVGPAADWYAMGVLLYIALTGRPPFRGEGDVVLELKQATEPVSPFALAPEIPADLGELCIELLRTDPAARPSGAQILQRLGAGPIAPSASTGRQVTFVGRSKELGQLHEAFQASRKGQTVTVLVHGESGVGKTALVDRFTQEVLAQAKDAVVLSGRCYERESVPYKALDEVVDGLSRHIRSLPAVEVGALLPRMASLLTQIFPVLLDVEVFAKAPALPHEILDLRELRSRAFGALRELLARLADRHPVVVAIDDLQWADADSTMLLAEILRPPLAPTLLLIGTVRTTTETSSTGRAPLESWYPQLGDLRHVQLHNLPAEDARQLVRLIAGDAQAEDQLNAAGVVQESGGHPLFIDALVRHRLSGGATTAAKHLDDALWWRLEAMDPLERGLVELISAAGRPLPQAVVAKAAGLDLVRFNEMANRLRRTAFVRTDGVRATDAIEPYHDKVRTSVRANLAPEQLQRCHERLAVAFESFPGADPETLSVHWQEAGSLDKAFQYTLAAAAQSVKALAFERAVKLYRRALELRPLEGEAARTLRVQLADALAQAGRGAEAAEAYRAAAALADGTERLHLTRRAGEQLLLSGHIDEGLAELSTVLAASHLSLARTPGRALTSLLWNRARLALRGTRFRERPASDVDPEVLRQLDLSFSVAQGLIWVDVIRGAEFQTRLIRRALDTGEPYRLVRALALQAGLTSTSGRNGPQKAAKLFETAEALAQRVGRVEALALVHAAEGFAALGQRQYRKSFELNARAEAVLSERGTGAFWEVALVRINLLFALRFLGELDELEQRGETWLRAAQERGDRFAATSMICGTLYFLSLARDEPASARRRVEEAMRRWSQSGVHLQHMYGISALGWTDLYEGKAKEGYQRLLDAWPGFERGSLLRLLVTGGWLRRQRASSALALAHERQGAERKRLIAEADALARILEPQPGNRAFARMIRASAAAARGDGERAASLYGEAAQQFAAADMTLEATAARHRQGRLIGGEAGADMVTAAERKLSELGVRMPARLAAMLSFSPLD